MSTPKHTEPCGHYQHSMSQRLANTPAERLSSSIPSCVQPMFAVSSLPWRDFGETKQATSLPPECHCDTGHPRAGLACTPSTPRHPTLLRLENKIPRRRWAGRSCHILLPKAHTALHALRAPVHAPVVLFLPRSVYFLVPFNPPSVSVLPPSCPLGPHSQPPGPLRSQGVSAEESSSTSWWTTSDSVACPAPPGARTKVVPLWGLGMKVSQRNGRP